MSNCVKIYGEEKPIKLICFPFAGCGASFYRNFFKELNDLVQVVSIQLPGREDRFKEGLITQTKEIIGEVVEDTLHLLNEPYYLFGHSLGALLAFEYLREIQSRGYNLPGGLIISGRRAPHIPETDQHIFNLSDVELVEELKKYNGTPTSLLDDSESMKIFLPIIRADLKLNHTYKFYEAPMLNCNIYAYCGVDDQFVTHSQLSDWKKHTTECFHEKIIEGDHFYLLNRNSGLVDEVMAIINT